VAFDNVGKTNLPVRSVHAPGLSFDGNPCMVKMSTSRIQWDASNDLPNGFRATNVLVSCQDVRAMGVSNLYMIVDLSGGTNVDHFTVSYTNCPPAGGWTEEYMTTKLVLRRVEPGSFMMGSHWLEDGHQANETQHKVTLTKPYYMAIYELTAKQFGLIYGTDGADTQPVKQRMHVVRGDDLSTDYTGALTTESVTLTGEGTYATFAATRYILTLTQNATGKYCWPSSGSVDPKSIMGIMRSKTALNFDLPTEAQWEYACRAGTTMPINIGETNSAEAVSLIKGDPKLDPTLTHYIYVGNYMPNALGIYDMSGNVDEWCLDAYTADLGTSDVIDPDGGDPVVKTETFTHDDSNGENGGRTYKPNANMVWNGKVWCTVPATVYGESLNYYTGGYWAYPWRVNVKYYSTMRVVRGADVRTGCRTSDAIWERDGTVVSVGDKQYDPRTKTFWYYGEEYAEDIGSDAAMHGVRITLTVDE